MYFCFLCVLYGYLFVLCVVLVVLVMFVELDELFAWNAESYALAVPSQSILDVNEPMYFIVGEHRGDTIARFQFSFMYRIFDAQGPAAEAAPVLRNLRFT